MKTILTLGTLFCLCTFTAQALYFSNEADVDLKYVIWCRKKNTDQMTLTQPLPANKRESVNKKSIEFVKTLFLEDLKQAQKDQETDGIYIHLSYHKDGMLMYNDKDKRIPVTYIHPDTDLDQLWKGSIIFNEEHQLSFRHAKTWSQFAQGIFSRLYFWGPP